jgi:disulfide bond formation protein DsbB
MGQAMRNLLPYLAWATALAAVGGSLYFSEVAGLTPCLLCWYQRILMFPLLVILTVGILRVDPKIHWYVLPFSLTGMGVAVYHYLLQIAVIPEKLAPCTAGVSCVAKQIFWLHFITIPFLSLIAFAIISTAMVVYAKAETK